MNSTWRYVILALAVALLLAAVTLFVIFQWILPGKMPFMTTEEPQYVIGNWQGQVAVFEGKQRYPMQVFDVYLNTLPAEERQQVLDGIPVTDGKRLWQVLENYTG